MKVFIWIMCFFCNALITNLLEVNGVILGAIPTVVLFGLTLWVAKSLCKAWDNHKKPECGENEILISVCTKCGYKGEYSNNCPRCGNKKKVYECADKEFFETNATESAENNTESSVSISENLKESEDITLLEQANNVVEKEDFEGGFIIATDEEKTVDNAMAEETEEIIVPTIEEKVIIEENEENPKVIFCRKCGAKLFEDSEFCHKCGIRVIRGVI